jgi:uncharacterized protein (TIGR02099 family)
MIKKSLVWLYSFSTYLLWAVVIVVAAVVLGLRWLVLPNVQNYKEDIAQRVSQAVGQKVTIGGIAAGWDGMQPHLDLRQVVVHDAANRPALSLDHIETSLSWLTLPLLEPRLATLTIHQPRLTIRRDASGTVFVAGMPMGGPSKPAFPNWLLRQSQIDVVDASVVWVDELRQAPPLSLDKLSLQVQNPAWESFYGGHYFGLRAQPSAGSSQPIDIRGKVIGKDVGKPEDWRGTLYAKLEGTDIAAWRTWVDLPVRIKEGFGATQVWLDFSGEKADKITADVVLANVVAPLGPESPDTTLKSLSGRLAWTRIADGHEMHAEKLRLLAEGLEMQNGNVRVRERTVDGKQTTDGSVRLDEISLEQLAAFAHHFSLGEEIRTALAEAAPSGLMRNLQLDWGASASGIDSFGLRSEFAGLSMQPYRHIPGFKNLGGEVDATEKGGTISFSGTGTEIEARNILRWPVPFDKLSGRATWTHKKDAWDVSVANLALSSPHLSGIVDATYQYTGKGAGTLDLTGKFTRADGRFAQFYYPATLSPDTLRWLDTSILGGRGENVSVKVKGDLDHFPWEGRKDGLFEVTADISDGTLHYADDWPQIEGIKLGLLFRGNRMELTATQGKLFGNQIVRAKAVIPELHVEHPVLEVTGELNAPPAEAIRYINASPILDAIDRFTENMQASGNGKLALGLHIPLSTDGEGSRVKGSYLIANGMLGGSGEMPKLENINGRLDFTESTLRAQNVAALIYGGPAQFNIESGTEGTLRVAAQGRMDGNGLRQIVPAVIADRFQGSADWTADILARKQQADVVIKSSLAGLSSSLPAPFAKAESDTLPLTIEKKTQNERQDQIAVSLGKIVNARLQRVDQNGAMTLERGEIDFGGTAEIPAQPGLALRGSLEHVDADVWQQIFATPAPAASGGNRKDEPGITINSANLAINALDVFGRRINGLALDAAPVSNGWRANIKSQEITGEALWIKGGNGRVVARLKSLIAPSPAPAKLSVPSEAEPQKEIQYPALDLIAENFEIKQKKLGRLELIASQQNIDWNIDKLVISNPDSNLTVSGVWSSWKRRPSTRLSLAWDIEDIGKTLDRFGYPDTVKGGKADLKGNLRWPGSPHEFTVAGLDGKLALQASNGQFLKIRPGVGRLLGVLSLQSLPRRLAFDFRDIFSSGFSFDKIAANAVIEDGVMRSDDFMMQGPAAKVAIKGETNLAKETQNLHIKVTPSISDSLSVAAFAGGPAVGVAAIVAQKLLNDPFNKLVAYEYDIAGTWDDPQEVKSKTVPAAPGPLGQ